MPYLGRKQVELWDPWEWLTLPQAVHYIVNLDHVEPEEARRQLHFALIDGALSLKWGTFGPPPNLSLPHRELETGLPPIGGPLWETAEIDWEAGTVLDNFDPENGKNEHRVLLIWRRHLVASFDPKAMIPKLPEPIKPLWGRASVPGGFIAGESRHERTAATRPHSGIRTNRDADAETAAGEWIAARAREWRESAGERMWKPETFEQVKEAVKNRGILSKKAFQRAWAFNSPQEWKEGGRPKRRKDQNHHP